jgi:hypothetical protein
MGQYFIVVNLTKKQYISPHDFGDDAKLQDFGLSSHGTMSALAVLLASSNGRGGGDLDSNLPIIGSWAGDQIAIVGDYDLPNRFGILAGEKPVIVQVGSKKGDTWTVNPDYQNLYNLISIDEHLYKKNPRKRKWKNISKKIMLAMRQGSPELKQALKVRLAR